LPKILAEACFLAQNGRPGPVLIDIPKDVGLEEISSYANSLSDLFEIITALSINNSSCYAVFIVYLKKGLPTFILCRWWSVHANGFKGLQQLKLFQIPLTTTLMGKALIVRMTFIFRNVRNAWNSLCNFLLVNVTY
jgi:acetolactate synthase-1/2/3 large subunit